MISFSKQQHIAVQLFILLGLLVNFWLLHWSILGIILGAFYLYINSKKLGDIFFPSIHNKFKNLLGVLIIFIYISLIYTLAYHLLRINSLVFLFTLLSIPLITEILSHKFNKKHYFFADLDIPRIRLANVKNLILPGLFLLTEILTFVLLFKKATEEVLRSPWELLGYKFWTLFIISSLLLIILILRHRKKSKTLLLISVHFLLLSSIALIIYPLGYGYDPFIHQATMKIIAATGTIEPRLFLYIGQYGWTFFLQSLSQLSLATTDKIILPLSFSVLWPNLLYYGLRYGLKWPTRISLLAVLMSLVVGFNFAIMTSPQNLAFLLMAIFIFLIPVLRKRKENLYFAGALGIAAVTIHPLGGLPILYLSLLLAIQKLNLKKIWYKIVCYFGIILSAISLPALLVIYQRLNGRGWSQIFTVNSWPLFKLPVLKFYHQYNFPLDFVHNIWDNHFYLYLILAIIGLILIIKKNKHLFFKKHLALFALLLINYLLARIFVSFDVQISYEQTAYLQRISYLMALSLLPISLTVFYFYWRPDTKSRKMDISKIWIIVLLLIIMSAGTYFSYPIYDRYGNSKSFNLTAADLKTVHLIEQSSDQEPYIVLANQMVGAAAIHNFGFAHYYQDNFYYSMPLGIDNIYQNYLAMIENNASREQALAAMDKAGVDKLYFVVNHYWHSAKTAIQQAQQSADSYFTVDDKNYVFVYQK